MKPKYTIPENHPHAGLLVACASGATFDQYLPVHDEWSPVTHPNFAPTRKYRISPTCDYALAQIANAGGDVSVDFYLYWLSGGELDFVKEYTSELNWLPFNSPNSNPYIEFLSFLTDKGCSTLRKRRNTVKAVLWIKLVEGECVETCWVKEGQERVSPWHEVPSKTKEVYEDEAV